MEKSAELLERVAQSEPIAPKLEAIQRGESSVRFSLVIGAAQPFLAAVIAHRLQALLFNKQRAFDSTMWILCPGVHSQEAFYESLLNWQPGALFLPEAELAGIENVLPDPEIAAERLALFLQIERDAGPRIIVATRASLDQAAPKRDTLQSGVIQLRRGATAKMEDLFEKFAGSGYQRVPQVTTRGQFAVRGGIVDLYSWHAPLPFRLEFFGDQIESLREFDIDTQSSVRDLRSVDILLSQAATDQSASVRDYLRESDLTIDIEPAEEWRIPGSADGHAPQTISRTHIQISEDWIETGPEDFSGAFQDCEIGEFGAGDLVLAEAKRARFVEQLNQWRTNEARILIYFQTEGEIERFRDPARPYRSSLRVQQEVLAPRHEHRPAHERRDAVELVEQAEAVAGQAQLELDRLGRQRRDTPGRERQRRPLVVEPEHERREDLAAQPAGADAVP